MPSNFTVHRADDCDHIEGHTACPAGYIQWHAWADKMAKTHNCVRCVHCGFWAIWKPKDTAAQETPTRQRQDRNGLGPKDGGSVGAADAPETPHQRTASERNEDGN